MNTQEIYKLAEEITEHQVSNAVSVWIKKTDSVVISEKKEAKEKIRLFESLVKLGDSKQLAFATVMLKKPLDEETKEFYRIAYEN